MRAAAIMAAAAVVMATPAAAQGGFLGLRPGISLDSAFVLLGACPECCDSVTAPGPGPGTRRIAEVVFTDVWFLGQFCEVRLFLDGQERVHDAVALFTELGATTLDQARGIAQSVARRLGRAPKVTPGTAVWKWVWPLAGGAECCLVWSDLGAERMVHCYIDAAGEL